MLPKLILSFCLIFGNLTARAQQKAIEIKCSMGTFSENLFLQMSTHCVRILCYVFGYEGRYEVVPALKKLKSKKNS